MLLQASATEPVTDFVSASAQANVLHSRQVIDAARNGDRAAIATLLTALQDCWYRMALSMLRDADAASDAVQETGLRFLRHISNFRAESQLRTWSLGIAINVVREMKRKRSRHQSGGGDVSDHQEMVDTITPSAVVRTQKSEEREALYEVMVDLPDRQREALVLRFFEDLSVDDTARAMGCAPGTVKATVHQALRSLRKRLPQWASAQRM